jgi:cytochrome c oxidase subunit 2
VFFVVRRWWFPEAISAHARDYDENFALTLIITGVIFLAAQFALGYVILRYRNQTRPVSGSEGNDRLELIWTAAAAILFVGLTLLSTRIWAEVHLDKPPAGALRIECLGKQFAWSFRYAGPDGKFGRTDIRQINDSNGNPFGIDEKDPAGKDDITTSAVRVPANKPVVLLLKSRDVIHNFFVRELRLKQDVVPGMEIPISFTAEKPGTYEVACSELCGLGHHQMRTTVIVLDQAEYDRWYREPR